ncbi:hypothetical protein [Niastella sp. OAS944]|uniref:hypothetical protein n=1 Tax=Niastella sp. OAS944 TaxID=2664089 RepID=UPI0034910C9F|nr:GR25 family glycosyltransferase involved in LPS biosynthesis [Chitinophagaceae bacterium OAS944]
MTIPTYIINLKSRTDRKEHCLNEFSGREEFCTTIVEACIHQYGNVGLWNSIKKIILELSAPDNDLILICEDDHLFTDDYSMEILKKAIAEAIALEADILSGGVSWFEDAVQASDLLFQVKKFSGTQFLIIFRKFFPLILEATFTKDDIADGKMASLSDRIFFINPFISVQKEFGYSDATAFNNMFRRVERLFVKSAARARICNSIRRFYNSMPSGSEAKDSTTLQNVNIPVYIINLPERTDRREHILQQFEGKTEFNITMIDACKHEIGAYGLWQSIRKAVSVAIENDDDVMIICEDDHEFSNYYTGEMLLRNILKAHMLGCDYLSGGSGKFDYAVPVSDNLFWANHFLSTQFIILYRKFFQTIIDAPFDETVIGDIKISQMTRNKMILFPYISHQKNFGYSDVTPSQNSNSGIVQEMFNHASERLKKMQQTHFLYSAFTNQKPDPVKAMS